MGKRKAFLLRLDPRVHTALERWARDDLRSVNAQVEFLLRDALRKAGRLNAPSTEDGAQDAGGTTPKPGD